MNADRREEHREHQKRLRQKDEDLRRLKRAENMARAAADALENARTLVERNRASANVLREAFFAQDLPRKRRQLEGEVL